MNLKPRAGRAALVSVLVFLGAGLDRASGARPQAGSFITIDVPGSTSTSAYSINNQGTIVGNYGDANGVHGFVRASGGEIATFDIPSSTQTLPVAINNGDAITGSYVDANGA
jgi:hypothetical protein